MLTRFVIPEPEWRYMISPYRILRDGDPDKLKSLESRIRNNDVSSVSTDKYNNTILHYAAMFGRDDIVEAILCERSYPHELANRTNDFGEASLHLAALGGGPKTVQILLEYDADPELLNNKGETILHYAAVGRFDTLAHILINVPQLNINHKGDHGLKPLDYALKYCRIENAILLLMSGSEGTTRPDLRWVEEDLLKFIPSRGLFYEELKWVLPSTLIRNPDLILSSENGPLLRGLKKGIRRLSPEQAASLLSEVEKIVGKLDERGLKALLSILEDLPDEVSRDLKAILKVLLGEEVELPDNLSLPKWAFKAFLDEIREGRLPYRILYHLDPKTVVSFLRWMDGSDTLCEVVRNYGPDRLVPHMDINMVLSFIRSCDEGTRDKVLSLIPPKELSKNVDYLIHHNMYDVLDIVLPRLTDKGILKVLRRAPKFFQHALENGRIKPTLALLKEMIRHAHKAGPMDSLWLEAIGVLLEEDPSILDRKDRWGNSLLHYAAFYPHLGVVKLLVRRGARKFLNVPNRAGYTPLSLALFSGRADVVEYLKSLGAKP